MNYFFAAFVALPFFAASQIEVNSPVYIEESPEERKSLAKEDRVDWFKLDGKYGFKNLLTGKVLVQPEYEEIDYYFSDFMVVQKSGKTGAINKKGEIVVPFEFQKIRSSSSNIDRRFPWILAAKNGFWGLIDAKGNTFLDFEWTEADFYLGNDSLVLLSKKGLQLLINREGRTVIETKFDRWEDNDSFYPQKLICARKSGKAGLVDFQNKVVLPFKFEQVIWMKGEVVCIQKNKRYGLFKIGGRQILAPEHGVIRPLDAHGLFTVGTMDAKKQGLMDSTGFVVLPIEYSNIYLVANKSLIAAENHDSKMAIFDLSGKQLTDFLFDKIIDHDFVPNLFFGRIGEQKYRLLNGKGEFVSPDIFAVVGVSPTAFSASLAVKSALFLLDGKQATPFKYGAASGFDSLINRERIVAKYNLPKDRTWIGFAYLDGSKQVFIDSEGNEFVP